MGPSATWSTGRWPCPWWGGRSRWSLRSLPIQTNLWFHENLTFKHLTAGKSDLNISKSSWDTTQIWTTVMSKCTRGNNEIKSTKLNYVMQYKGKTAHNQPANCNKTGKLDLGWKTCVIFWKKDIISTKPMSQILSPAQLQQDYLEVKKRSGFPSWAKSCFIGYLRTKRWSRTGYVLIHLVLKEQKIKDTDFILNLMLSLILFKVTTFNI